MANNDLQQESPATADSSQAEPPPLLDPTVLEAEWKAIRQRRDNVRPSLPKPDDKDRSLVGLALSGGGVRSASFNLGLLQAFLRYGLLRHVDYLSTVSGGGYIGSYLSALLRGSGEPLSKDNAAVQGASSGGGTPV